MSEHLGRGNRRLRSADSRIQVAGLGSTLQSACSGSSASNKQGGRGAEDIQIQPGGSITREERWQRGDTRGCTVWFTGLPASGKSTLASALERKLVESGLRAYRLDGDNIRKGLNSDLGFSAADRAENIRRIGEVARLFADSGCVALTAFISPYTADRERCRALHMRDGLLFLEVFLDAPLAVCEMRDPKGMYRKARAGLLKGFTGIDDPYEPPLHPDLVLNTGALDVAACIEACLGLLKRCQVIPAAPL